MTTSEKVTQEQLESFPKKTLLIMCKEMELTGLSKKPNETIIEAILAAQDEEVNKGTPHTEEFTEVVKTSSDAQSEELGKTMLDINTLSLADLALLRPDLVKKLQAKTLEDSPEMKEAIKRKFEQKQLFEVKVGPIGPLQVEAHSQAEALQLFMNQSGCTGFSKLKPSVRMISHN